MVITEGWISGSNCKDYLLYLPTHAAGAPFEPDKWLDKSSTLKRRVRKGPKSEMVDEAVRSPFPAGSSLSGEPSLPSLMLKL